MRIYPFKRLKSYICEKERKNLNKQLIHNFQVRMKKTDYLAPEISPLAFDAEWNFCQSTSAGIEGFSGTDDDFNLFDNF